MLNYSISTLKHVIKIKWKTKTKIKIKIKINKMITLTYLKHYPIKYNVKNILSLINSYICTANIRYLLSYNQWSQTKPSLMMKFVWKTPVD